MMADDKADDPQGNEAFPYVRVVDPARLLLGFCARPHPTQRRVVSLVTLSCVCDALRISPRGPVSAVRSAVARACGACEC